MPATEATTTEENMTLSKCPLEFIKDGDRFFVARQTDIESVNNYKPQEDANRTDPIELTNGCFIKKTDGKVYDIIIEDKKLNAAEVSYPDSESFDETGDTFTYRIDGVEIVVSKPKEGSSKVRIGSEEKTYIYNDPNVLKLPNNKYLKLQSVYQKPTRVILYQKLSTNLPQS